MAIHHAPIHSPGRDNRRHQALVAHLKACGEWELSALDKSHPVVASATMAELEAALLEASRLLRCPLQNKVERWLGGAVEFSCGLASEWLPLRDARHANLQWHSFSRGNVFFAHNAIEVFQVCAYNHSDKLYHVQPLSAPEAAAYFIKRRGLIPSMRLEAPIQHDFTPTRGPYSSMNASMLTTALAHTRLGDIPAWEQPLHDFILSNL